jgi:hypothetical protein
VLGGELVQKISDRWPSHWRDRVSHNLAHEHNSLTQQINLHFVPGFSERQPVREGKGGFGGIIRTPCALHQNFERLAGGLSLECGSGDKGKRGELRHAGKKCSACHSDSSSERVASGEVARHSNPFSYAWEGFLFLTGPAHVSKISSHEERLSMDVISSGFSRHRGRAIDVASCGDS